jgi:hypothetical protein
MAMPDSGTTAQTAHVRCGTRALKNARYLQEKAPHLAPTEATDEGFGSGIPVPILARLHRLQHDSPELRAHPALASFIHGNPVPPPAAAIRGPLFNGALHFVQATFHTPSQNFVIPTADMNTIVQYAQHAITPIDEYAAQYGSTVTTVAPAIITYAVTLRRRSYGDADVKRWVNDIVTRNHLPANDAVVIVSPRGLTAPNVNDNAGYHGLANVPYTIFGVFATGLTLQDLADKYAMVVSHEIAELIVDPKIDHANPEVCDPCDLNCGAQNLNRAYFDATIKYLGTVRGLPPVFAFSFYVCAVVKPSGAANCPAASGDCVYPPVPH